MSITLQQYLHKYFTYNATTGDFIVRKYRSGSNKKVGQSAISNTKSTYLQLKIKGKTWKVHNLIYIYMLGTCIVKPAKIIHINRNQLDLRWRNLRVTDNSSITCRSKRRKDNKTGVKGMHWELARKAYKCTIAKNHTHYYFRTRCKEEGRLWLHQKRLELHGQYAEE